MTVTTILAIAVALAMDAFAVSLATGMQLRAVSLPQTLRMAGVFGGFQFLMPVLGWLLGVKAQSAVQAYGHWLAFGLLAFVGLRMLKQGWEKKEEREEELTCACPPDPTRGGSLWLLGLATSLDALAVGLSLALLDANVWLPAVIIGLVCFTLSAVGLHLGRLICSLPGLGRLGDRANALGGAILLLIGLKILHENGVFI